MYSSLRRPVQCSSLFDCIFEVIKISKLKIISFNSEDERGRERRKKEREKKRECWKTRDGIERGLGWEGLKFCHVVLAIMVPLLLIQQA